MSRMLSPKDFGAKGDYNSSTGIGTDDTRAFLAMGAFMSAADPKSFKGIHIPAGKYLVTDSVVNKVIFSFNGLDGFIIDAANAVIVRGGTQFPENQTEFFFKFDNCKNITAIGPKFETIDSLKLDLLTTGQRNSRGYTPYWFNDNNENIRLEGQHVSDNYRLVLFGSGAVWRSNKNIFVQGVIYKCSYGTNFANSGENATVQLSSELVHRTYFAYGVKNHVINLNVKNFTTTGAVIKAYEYDTENIKGEIFLQYTDDPIHKDRLGSGVHVYTDCLSGSALAGNIKNIDLSITARDSSAEPHYHEAVFNLGTFYQNGSTVVTPGYLDNITVDLDAIWKGGQQFRPAIAFLGVSSKNADGSPIFGGDPERGQYREPLVGNIKFRNISIHGYSGNKSMEMCFKQLRGDCILENFDGNLSPNLLNLGDTGRIIFKNVNIHRGLGIAGGARSALDFNFLRYSKNHYIENIYMQQEWGTGIPRVCNMIFQKPYYESVATNPAGDLTEITIPLNQIRPVDGLVYRINGKTSGYNFSGLLEIKWDDVVKEFLPTTKFIRWEAYDSNTLAPTSDLTPSIVVDSALAISAVITGGGDIVVGSLNNGKLSLVEV